MSKLKIKMLLENLLYLVINFKDFAGIIFSFIGTFSQVIPKRIGKFDRTYLWKHRIWTQFPMQRFLIKRKKFHCVCNISFFFTGTSQKTKWSVRWTPKGKKGRTNVKAKKYQCRRGISQTIFRIERKSLCRFKFISLHFLVVWFRIIWILVLVEPIDYWYRSSWRVFGSLYFVLYQTTVNDMTPSETTMFNRTM